MPVLRRAVLAQGALAGASASVAAAASPYEVARLRSYAQDITQAARMDLEACSVSLHIDGACVLIVVIFLLCVVVCLSVAYASV